MGAIPAYGRLIAPMGRSYGRWRSRSSTPSSASRSL
jgi:hypothetical protein